MQSYRTDLTKEEIKGLAEILGLVQHEAHCISFQKGRISWLTVWGDVDHHSENCGRKYSCRSVGQLATLHLQSESSKTQRWFSVHSPLCAIWFFLGPQPIIQCCPYSERVLLLQ